MVLKCLKKKLILFWIILLVLPFFSASQTSSSNYGVDSIVSSGGNASSTNYNAEIVLDSISGNLSSISYKQTVGFVSTTTELPSVVPPASPATPPSGGGGTSTTISGFFVNPDLIKVLIKQGESQRELVSVKNLESTPLNIVFELDELERFMVISEDNFTLNAGETKDIFIDFFAKEKEVPDAYTGRILVKDNAGVTKVINVIIEVSEKAPLFDVLVNLISDEAAAGEKIKARFKVINFGDLENIDILLSYSVKDFEGNLLSFKEESVRIKKELDIIRELNIPQDTQIGDYVYYLKVSYGNITASATESFRVIERKRIPLLLIFSIIFLVITLFLVLIILKILRHFKERPLERKKKKEIVLTKKSERKEKIVVPKKIVKEKVKSPKKEITKKIVPSKKDKVLPEKKNRAKKAMYSALLEDTVKMKKEAKKKK